MGAGGILEQARRSSRYSDEEISTLAFEGSPPDAAHLSHLWHEAVEAAGLIIPRLPASRVGQAVLTRDGRLFMGDLAALDRALEGDDLVSHPGRIGGAFPDITG